MFAVGFAAFAAALIALLDRGDPLTSSTSSRRVPILTYHAISEPPRDARHPDLFVAPDDFSAQMIWLRENGFQAVTLNELRQGWDQGSPLPHKPVVISFDDGLQTQFTEALPTLRDLDWPGVLNLKLESLRQGELTDAMVGRMIAAGWEIGSHSVTHPRLTRLGERALTREVAGSRRILQTRLGVTVRYFCYPYGSFDARVVEAVRDSGYTGATTTRSGFASATDDPYRLPRLRVKGSADLDEFAAEIDEPAAGG